MDFFLISKELVTVVENSNIRHGYRSDHSLIDLFLKFGDHEKGRGFWSFNNSLLKDTELIELVKTEIRNTKEQYVELPESVVLEDISDYDIKFNIDDKLFLKHSSLT